MPSTSPVKQRQSVTFKVTIPSTLDRIQDQHTNKSLDKKYYSSDKANRSTDTRSTAYHSCSDRTSKDRSHDSNRISCSDHQTFDLRQKIKERAGLKYNKENRRYHNSRETETKETLHYTEEFARFHLPNSGGARERQVRSDTEESYNTTSVLDGLRNSSKGRVTYNRQPVLSEDEFPPQNQIKSVHSNHSSVHSNHSNHTSALESVCRTPDQQPSKAKARGRAGQVEKVEEVDPARRAGTGEIGHDPRCTFSEQLDNTLSVIESMEFLSDSVSLLTIEKKSKKASIELLEREKAKQDQFFRKSAQLSIDNFERWREESKVRIDQQVRELKERKSKKDSSIETEFREQQRDFQKRLEEHQASLKRAEQEEKAETARQVRERYNNITNYELTVQEIMSITHKCVPNPSVDPVIEALYSSIDTHTRDISTLKNLAGEMYKDGKLGWELADKFERDIMGIYCKITEYVSQLNLEIKRVNELTTQQANLQSKKEETHVPPQASSEAPVTPQASSEHPPSVTSVVKETSKDNITQPHTEDIIQSLVISKSAFEQYMALRQDLQKLEKTVEKLVKDKSTDISKMRSALKLVTVTPINSISASSNQHMANKVTELVNILDGKETVRGNKRISPGFSSLTLNYCFNIAASKFVDQGCEQVAFSDNLVPAFSIAVVITGIWQKHAKFGDLFLAHLHKRCPYSIPAHWTKTQGESNEEYLRRLGYSNDDDKLEDRDKFLLKMAGCIKLYGAVIQSPPTFPNMPHPHGLSHGWSWLSRTLNMVPVADVTATLLEAFLKVTGAALHVQYGTQFLKLLEYLYTEYLPKLEGVTKADNLGPITRLKLYLEKINKTKTIPVPDGRITDSICSLPGVAWPPLAPRRLAGTGKPC